MKNMSSRKPTQPQTPPVAIKNKSVEKLPKSAVRLSLTVEQRDVRDTYHTLLKRHVGNAKINGFRKGKVPLELVEHQIKDELHHEVALDLAQRALQTALQDTDQRPLHYASPSLESHDPIDIDQDFNFSIVYDVYPQITVGNYRGLTITVPQVTISDEDVQNEIEAIRQRQAITTDKVADAEAEVGDIATIDFWESDADNKPISDTKREGVSMQLGSERDPFALGDDIIGMRLGEQRCVEKTFGDDHTIEAWRRSQRIVCINLTALKRRILPDIDDELAQDVDNAFETLEQLRAHIGDTLRRQLDERLRQIKIGAIMEQVLTSSSLEIPESMLAMELNRMWKSFMSRIEAQRDEQAERFLQERNHTKAQLIDEWKPAAERNLSLQLLIIVIAEREKITIADSDVEAEIGRRAERSSMSATQALEWYRRNNLFDSIRADLRDQALFGTLFPEMIFQKGDNLKLVDVLQDNDYL